MKHITEVLTAQQRMKRAMILSRNRSKIERARERSRGRLADAKKIVERAMRLARKIVRTRVVGERGERYEELSTAEKVEIDKVMQKRKDAVKKVALRLIQNVRKKEFERYKSFYAGKQLDHLHSESVQEQNTEMLLEQMIGAAQHLLITEQDSIRLQRTFGTNDDFDLYKNYFVESLALEDNDSDMAMFRVSLLEDLDKWFKEKWVRVDTKGNIKGDCAREEGEGKPKCLPFDRARGMSKEDRATAARRKRRQDPDVDRPGTGNEPINVATESLIVEKNAPKDPKLWARAKAWAKSTYDVYPSAYANGGAVRWYNKRGGKWKKISEDVLIEAQAKRRAGVNYSRSSAFVNLDPIGKGSTIARKQRQGRSRLSGGVPGGRVILGASRVVNARTGLVTKRGISDNRRKVLQIRRAGVIAANMRKAGGGVQRQYTPERSGRSRIRTVAPRARG